MPEKKLRGGREPLFTDEQEAFYRAHCRNMPYANQIKLMNKKFGLTITFDQIKGWRSNHKFSGSRTGRFEKGRTPWSKGKKWDEIMPKESQEHSRTTQFKKGHIPKNYKPVGSERVNVDGYIEVKVEDPRKWELKHRYVYRQAYGTIPKRSKIVFLDQNKLNCDIDNLILVPDGAMGIVNHMKLTSDPALNKTIINWAILEYEINKNEK